MRPTIRWDITQGTDQWLAARAGKWSSSKAAVIMGGPGTKGLDDLIKDIAWGRVFGPPDDRFQSAAMHRGNEVEPEGREWYAFEKRVTVVEAGLVEHATVPNVIWSPDGLILDGDLLIGGIECKSLLHKGWMEAKRERAIPYAHRWQCRWGMWTGALEYLDAVIYHPLSGGLIMPCELKPEHVEQMTARVYELEVRVRDWVEILTDKKERRAQAA